MFQKKLENARIRVLVLLSASSVLGYTEPTAGCKKKTSAMQVGLFVHPRDSGAQSTHSCFCVRLRSSEPEGLLVSLGLVCQTNGS